jgi:hypothetical protein
MTNLLLHFSKSEIDDLLVLERGEGPYVFDTDGGGTSTRCRASSARRSATATARRWRRRPAGS